MAMYVYEDEARTKEIWAKNATIRNKSIRYYCPNPCCNAKMFLWNLDGESASYFQASSKPGHLKNCAYGSENSYNPSKTSEKDFDAENAIKKMMEIGEKKEQLSRTIVERQVVKKTGKSIPHTIRQIYDICKAHACRDEFNGYTIGQILVDNRSIFMYPKGIFGYKIIEARCRKRFYDGKSILLETPINEANYQLEIRFQNERLFKEIRGLIYNNRGHVIIIAGKWESTNKYNCFSTELYSKKQIKILRQEI